MSETWAVLALTGALVLGLPTAIQVLWLLFIAGMWWRTRPRPSGPG